MFVERNHFVNLLLDSCVIVMVGDLLSQLVLFTS